MKKVSKNQAAVALGNRSGKAHEAQFFRPSVEVRLRAWEDWRGPKVFLPKSTPSKAPAHFRTARLPIGMSTLINKRPTICVVGTIPINRAYIPIDGDCVDSPDHHLTIVISALVG
jgi:hypothetical protein